MQFIKSIQNFSAQYNLWTKGSKILIGVSGGPDSVCLFDIMYKLSKKYDFELCVAHVNYGLRGLDSDQDEKFVRKLAEKHGVELKVLDAKKNHSKGNLENNLRQIRYDFFEQVRKELGFDIIAIAHNQDDQAETVLMRIIRGSSLNGLSAIRARNGKVIRPLLGTSRKEIMSYLQINNLQYRTDKTNNSLDFTRNVLRHQLLPYLEKEFNPSIKKTLSFNAQYIADDYDYIAKQAGRFVKASCKNKYAHFSSAKFLDEHVAIQRQVLRAITNELVDAPAVETGQLEEMRKLIKSNKNKIQRASIAGLNIVKKGDKIDIFCQ